MSSRFTTRGLARSLCYAPGFLRLRGSSGSFRRPHKSVSGEEADVNNRRVFTGAVANELNNLNKQDFGFLHLLWMMSVDSVANSYQFNGLSSKVLLFYEIVILVKN